MVNKLLQKAVSYSGSCPFVSCSGEERKKRPCNGSPKEQVLLVLLWGFVECGNRKALGLRVQGVYLCK